MKTLYITLLLLFGFLSPLAASEVRVELKNGSIITGRDITAPEEEIRRIDSGFGILEIPETEIQSIRYPYEKNIIYESWILQSLDGKAKATFLIRIPESKSEDLMLPVIESSYKPLLTAVTNPDRKSVPFEQVDRGPITFLKISRKSLPESTRHVLVEFTTASAFQENSDGAPTLVRRFTAGKAGAATIEVQTADNLEIKVDDEISRELTVEKTLRRQENWMFEAVVLSASE